MFTLDTMLEYHLTSNHYPPLPRALIPVAKEAIDYGRLGDFDALIDMPHGIVFREQSTITAGEAIESMHLEGFLEVVLEDA